LVALSESADVGAMLAEGRPRFRGEQRQEVRHQRFIARSSPPAKLGYGYGIRTETSDDGTQRYHLVLPKGVIFVLTL
jgi:hypothetical protein